MRNGNTKYQEGQVIFSTMDNRFPKKFSYNSDCLVLLAACLVPSVLFNGIGGVKVIAASVVTAVLTDLFGTLILSGDVTLSDRSAVITGFSVAMLLSGSVPVYVAAIAAFVAVAVGKLPFGRWDRAPFVPAAVGTGFVCVIYPDICFSYPAPFTGAADTAESLAMMLKNGNSVNMTAPGVLNVLVGNCPGQIGTTCGIFFAACLVYYLIRNIDSFIVSAGFISVCFMFAALFPRVPSGRRTSVLMELCGGALLFTAVFLMTYPNVKFRSVNFALYYGMTGGAVYMLIRYFGAFEDGAPFAVLIMNALSPLFSGNNRVFSSNGRETDTGEGGA